MNVVEKDKWLNKTDNRSIKIENITEEHKKKISALRTGAKNPFLTELNKSRIGDKNPSKREDVKKKISKAKSGENNSMYGVTGKNHPRYGKPGASLGKKWFYNPTTKECKYFEIENAPVGWVKGRYIPEDIKNKYRDKLKNNTYFLGKPIQMKQKKKTDYLI